MNARIAALLKDRISQFTYVDKLAGLVRAISYERNGERITVPVCDDVDDQLACSDTAMRDMVPDAAYQAIVYFEDRGLQSIQSRTRGLSYRSSLRLVCWINTAKFGSDSEAGSKVMQQFIGAIDDGPYASSPFLGIRHRVEGVPQRGPGLFSPYTYPESARQYLLYPYDAFALDITTELRIIPGCEDEVTLGNDECWTPTTQRRRRFPREFSCEELNDAATGLTDEQKEDCLDCEGGTECPEPCDVVATLVNDAQLVPCIPSGDRTAVLCALMQMPEITVEAAVVCADGAGLTAGLQAALCPSCGPLTIRINGVDYSDVADPCGTVGGVRVKDAADNDVGSLDGPTWRIPSVTVQLKDSAKNPIGSADSYLPGANTSKTAPDGSIQRKDSANNNIGSPIAVRSNQTGLAVTCPDGTVANKASSPTYTLAVKSNSTEVLPKVRVQLRDGSTVDYDYLPTPTVIHTEQAVANVTRTYTAGDTWNKPAGLKEVLVLAVGAGGGGGSGRRGAASSQRSAGGGGGGGAMVWRRIPAASLASSETITIGAGGPGGAAQTADSSNGNAGTIGGDTSFGTLVIADGGGSGAAGSTGGSGTGGSSGGLASACTPAFGPNTWSGHPRVTPSASNGSDGSNGLNGSGAAPSGGAGGGISAANAVGSGGAGGGCYNGGSLTAGPAGGAASGGAGNAGTANVGVQLLLDLVSLAVGIGTAGSGGGGSIVGVAGSGGNAGNYGAGGGGGGASLNGNNSGAGGNGSGGLVVLVEIYD